MSDIKCYRNNPGISALNSDNSSKDIKSDVNDIRDNSDTYIQFKNVEENIFGPKESQLSEFSIVDDTSLQDDTKEKISISKSIADIVPERKTTICLQDFNIIRVIGRGNFSKVLMVESKAENKLYAMKVIKKLSILEDEDIEWIKVEKNIYEIATNHPFLVGLHSCFHTPSRLYYIIELVQGGDLMFHMQKKRKLPEDHVMFYSAEVALALNFLHRNGIIYRDIKLDNVLLGIDGHIKLTDYGMCKQGIHGDKKTSTFCGTPNYMAPEILRNENYSSSVDWWALGVMMYEMMVGCSPFNIEQLRGKTEDYLFQIILTCDIIPPKYLSYNSRRVLSAFLIKDPCKRLGCKGNHGFKEIKCHSYFYPINWEKLEAKQVKPPFIPSIRDVQDFDNFPIEYTSETLDFSFDDEEEISKIDQDEFNDFGYVNPLLALRTNDMFSYNEETANHENGFKQL